MKHDERPAPHTEGGDSLDTGAVPDVRDATARYLGIEKLQEGVYFEVDRRVGHYVLQATSDALCGSDAKALYRRVSSWAFVPDAERCPLCAPRVTERGTRRHGWVARGDPPLGDLGQRSRAEEQRQLRAGGRPKRWEPRPAVGTKYHDPPFDLSVDDPYRSERVLNDVYGRAGNGKKWHRIYAVGERVQAVHLLSLGRAFLFACGEAGGEYDLDRISHSYFEPQPVFVGVPAEEDRCRSCAASDARWGKGIIPNDARWDR